MTKRKEGLKDKGGRPTKYTEDIPARMLDFFQSFEYTKETTDGKITSGEYPTFEEFFVEHLHISTEQISDYKKYDEFSRAYTACQAIQKKFLIGHSLKGRYKENFATFILRANHKMYDRPDHEEVDLTKVSSTDLDILKEKIEIILAERKNASTIK